jgi:polyferredoxin
MSKNKPWSLQNDKRTEAERNIFKPTGKSPKSKFKWYLVALAGVLFAVSFFMTYFSENVLHACIGNYCFNSQDNLLVYTLYVFFTIIIVVFAVFGAYIVGRKLADLIKK